MKCREAQEQFKIHWQPGKTNLAQEWDVSEVPTIYFNRIEKAMQQLARAGITSDLKERIDMAHYYFKNTGEYDAAVREWEAKPVATKTWTNIKLFMSTEYAKESKQNKQSAKQLKANAMEEQAEATEELIANLTEAHTRQVESLIKANMETMKEMMSFMKKRKRRERKGRRNFSTHRFASTLERNIPPRRKMNVGNWTRMQHRVHHHGSQLKTIDGVRGLK